MLVVAGVALRRARLDAPDPSLLLRDRHGRFLGVTGESDDRELGYWPLAQVPSRVAAATLAAEDRRFSSHSGVDALAVGRAIRQAIAERRVVSGASTLAMQVARMQDPGRRRLSRKIVEAATAIALTARFGREEILLQYLRLAPYGNRIHGIAFAARRYFDKPVEDLSWAETAFLVAIPQAPGRMNPWSVGGRAAAIHRAHGILYELMRTGALSAVDHAQATRQLASIRVPHPKRRPPSALHAILLLEARLASPEERARFAMRPIVDTTLDLDIQEEAAWIALSAVDEWRERGAGNAAIVVTDARTAEVLAWIGSTDYFDAGSAGAIDYARTERSPGSLLKPFVYALALDRSVISPATILDDLARGPGGISNSDGLYLGPVLPRVALANSRNVPAADLIRRVGLDSTHAFLGDLGLHDGSEPARRYGLGLAIGTMPVTLEDAMTAYSALAGEGVMRELRWLKGPASRGRRVLSEDSAREIALFLSDPMARQPSFPRLGPTELPFPVAVKTGTSSRHRDAWAVAWSQRLVVGAWVGHPDCHSMKDLTGHRAAARLAQRMLLSQAGSEADGMSDVSFPAPRQARSTRLCALSGELATDACDRIVDESLLPGQVPHASCRIHVRVAIDTRTGLRATARTPRGSIDVRTFVDAPPRLAAWAASAGLASPPSATIPIENAWRMMPAPRAIQRVAITSPQDGIRVARDLETPAEMSTLALEAIVDPPLPQLTWYVDGAPLAIAARPYSARWRLAPGAHRIQARLPGGAMSRAVRVIVD